MSPVPEKQLNTESGEADELLQRLAYRVYRIGIVSSAILIVAGLALEWAGGIGWKWKTYYIWNQEYSSQTTLIFLGLLLLILTPLTRVGAALVFSIRRREWMLVLLTSIVLLLVLVSAILNWYS